MGLNPVKYHILALVGWVTHVCGCHPHPIFVTHRIHIYSFENFIPSSLTNHQYNSRQIKRFHFYYEIEDFHFCYFHHTLNTAGVYCCLLYSLSCHRLLKGKFSMKMDYRQRYRLVPKPPYDVV